MSPKPTALTKRSIRELGWGLRPVSEVLDARRGVVTGCEPNCATEECPPRKAMNLCQADLDPERFRRGFLGMSVDDREGMLDCKNGPVRECVSSEQVDEWSNYGHARFTVDPARGLVLESWFSLDEGLTSAESVQDRRNGSGPGRAIGSADRRRQVAPVGVVVVASSGRPIESADRGVMGGLGLTTQLPSA